MGSPAALSRPAAICFLLIMGLCIRRCSSWSRKGTSAASGAVPTTTAKPSTTGSRAPGASNWSARPGSGARLPKFWRDFFPRVRSRHETATRMVPASGRDVQPAATRLRAFRRDGEPSSDAHGRKHPRRDVAPGSAAVGIDPVASEDRSEEHTSELQSPDHLVCRLLLEKKKQLKSAAYSDECMLS